MSRPGKYQGEKPAGSAGVRHPRAEPVGAERSIDMNAVLEPSGAALTERQDNLFTKVVPLDSKAFYLDVRENKRGKYLKLTESGASGRNTLLLSGAAIKTVLTVLDDAIKDKYDVSVKGDGENNNKWQTVYSQKVVTSNKKIYVDIMVNKRGRSLNIAEVSTARHKTSVVMFERGWFQLKRALEEILDKFPELNSSNIGELENTNTRTFDKPNNVHNNNNNNNNNNNHLNNISEFASKPLSSQVLELENKKLFFDFLSNDAGRYLRVSEVRRGKRENVYIPALCFPVFAELLQKLLVKDYTSSVTGLDNLPLIPRSEDKETVVVGVGAGERSSRDLVKRSLKVEDERGNNSRRYSLDLRENSFGKFLRVAEHRLFKRHNHNNNNNKDEGEEVEGGGAVESQQQQQQQGTRSAAVYFPEESFQQIRGIFINLAAIE